MEVKRAAVAGTHESNDALVEISPAASISVEIESIVKNQYEDAIYAAVRGVLDELDVRSCAVKVFDHGALDCVLRARTETALLRAAEGEML